MNTERPSRVRIDDFANPQVTPEMEQLRAGMAALGASLRL